MQKMFIAVLLRIAEVFLVPLTMLGAIWLGLARRCGIAKLPLTRSVLLKIGVFPIRDHYYEPQFKFGAVVKENKARELPCINFNVYEQLKLLERFRFQNELLQLPVERQEAHEFYYTNGMFGSGDAEFLYSLVRLIKPRQIIEIGSGFSTLMAGHAIRRNRKEDQTYDCIQTCIEPYENPWLDKIGVKLVRQRLEEFPFTDFAHLERNDILFIDSSHIIRHGGDVLHEFLEILPRLQSGVYVHIHDIFTPFDYPDQWVRKDVRFWNEQYLLEAFLPGNSEYIVAGAMCFLSRRFPEKLAEKFPVLATAIDVLKPGSFWLVRR
jgi:hypothetical protein